MVLVRLQNEWCNREVERSLFVRRYSVPQCQDLERCPGVCRPCMQPAPRTVAYLFQPADCRQQRQNGLNGLITNDQYCLTRIAHVQQITRRAQRLGRAAPTPLPIYPSDGLTHLGGSDETAMACLPHHDHAFRRATALGSGILAPPPVGVGQPTGAGSQGGPGTPSHPEEVPHASSRVCAGVELASSSPSDN